MRDTAVVRAVGIDLAADPRNTGAAVAQVGGSCVVVTVLDPPLDDDALVALAVDADVVGVDAPLGWPDDFVAAVTLHHAHQPWPDADEPVQQRRMLSNRLTDRECTAATGLRPLSVSADRIAAVAMRCARLQTLWAATWGSAASRAGTGRLVETYPAAALKHWTLTYRRYKGTAGATSLGDLVDALTAGAPWIDLSTAGNAYRASDHCFDAIVCALIALAAKTGLTTGPNVTQLPVAEREGWIHVPTCTLADLGDALLR